MTLTPFRKIAISVFLLHISFGLCVFLQKTPPLRKKNSVITVKTFTPPPVTIRNKAKPTAPAMPKSTPKKVPSTPPTTSPPTIPPKPKQPPTSTIKAPPPPPKKKSPPPEKKTKPTPNPAWEKSLQEIKETIAKIEAENAKMEARPKRDFPKEERQEEDLYPIALAGCLRQAVQLPEMGEVQIEITLFANGAVKALRVLASQSSANQKRLETALPTLHLPPPPDGKEQTFVLTLCNEL